MVSSGSALSACIMLLLGSFAFARDMDENTGYVTKVLHNNENGGIDMWRAPAATLTTAAAAAVDRRNPMPSSASSSSAYDPTLVSLLFAKKQWVFCKAYINLHPTVTETVTKTTCGDGPECSPTTVTSVVGLTLETTAIVTDPPLTVTIEPVSTITTTVTETVANPTLTSTVGTPLVTAAARKRNVSPPAFLSSYAPAAISAACSQLVKHVIHTTTKTQTLTVTAFPGTAALTETQTATTTVLTTTTPLATVTDAASTTTVTETETSTTISTVCPAQQTAAGMTAAGGMDVLKDQADVVACCSACYDSAAGCSGWYFYAPLGFCTLASASESTDPSAQCPSGLGSVGILPGTVTDDGFGGLGPCFGGGQV